ncbi:MAG: alpha/beta hydrolase [Acidobacteriales bacterium]|nr:alpha/beta hydrolase [Terriglobales bacterium]
MARNGNQELLLYIHGTRFRFDESATWAAQFGYDVQFPGPVIVFSWPSGEGRWDYMEGETNTEWSRPHLTALLRDLSREFPDAHIHVVAHSLGARLLMHSLDEMGREDPASSRPKFGQVVLAAADVDSEIFRRLLPGARALSQRITAYVAADDRALGASAKVHGYPRTGRDLDSPEGVDVIDATRTDGSDYNHNYFTQNRRVLFDLFQLLREGTPPDHRFGLVRMENGGHVYWQLRP